MYRVRQATAKDLDVLVAFTTREATEAEAQDLHVATLRRGILAGLENSSIARYWVLVETEENHVQQRSEKMVVGSASVVREWSDWKAGYYWWIQSMFLQPSHRGRGLLNLMIEEIRQVGRHEGALELRLYVHQDNLRAQRAYAKVGFQDSPYQIMSIKPV